MGKPLQIFEHDKLTVGHPDDFKDSHKKLLEAYHKKYIQKKSKYSEKPQFFSLIKDGVQFKQYVGVIKVGNLTIEVLPKIDGLPSDPQEEKVSKKLWQNFLYEMFKYSDNLKASISSVSQLNSKNNNFLEIYIKYFLNEVEYLQRTGLIRKYHKTEGSLNSLRGGLLFSKHITKHIIHKEKFFCSYTKYDSDNMFNQMLYKALNVLDKKNVSSKLNSQIKSILLNFPEVKNIEASKSFFDKIVYDRKSNAYKLAIGLAKFIILNLHPDLKSGGDETYAIMFDMNKLWEKYVFKKLKYLIEKDKKEFEVKSHKAMSFWRRENHKIQQIDPDIVVSKIVKTPEGTKINTHMVLDTKWKLDEAESNNLKQMFVYNQFYFDEHTPKKVVLLYPSIKEETKVEDGTFINPEGRSVKFGECSLIYLALNNKKGKLELDFPGLVKYVTE